MENNQTPRPSLIPPWGQWGILLALSLCASYALRKAAMPAPVLLGAMGSAVFAATSGWRLKVPRIPFTAAQGAVGCLIANSITKEALLHVANNWLLVIVMVLSVSVLSAFLGWLLARTGILPGTTAVWGLSPGAALLMTIMSEDHGGDSRLVAFMQYLRVMLVALTAAVVAGIWGGTAAAVSAESAAAAAIPAPWWPPFVLILASIAVGKRFRFASGPIMLPLLVGGLLSGMGIVHIAPPAALLFASYIVIGWSIGLRFTRDIVHYALRALPVVVAAILGLLLSCGLLAFLFGWLAGVEPMTAYLATSPGGMDAVAIIAASSDANVSFVVAVQTARFLIVTLTSPAIASRVSRMTAKN